MTTSRSLRRMWKAGLVFLMIWCASVWIGGIPVYAAGTSYYVATNGSDANPGTLAQPFATIGKAASLVNPGDTVYVRGGTYNETVSITRSGNASGWITFRNYPGETPFISSAGDAAIDIPAVDYIEINGFTVTATGTYGCGIRSNKVGNDIPHHLHIYNNIVKNNSESGIALLYSDYVHVKGNIVFNNARVSPYDGSGINLYQAQKLDSAPGFHNIVEGNISYKNQNDMGFLGGGHTDGNGIIIDWPGNGVAADAAPTLIQNNLLFDNGGRGISLAHANNVTVINNTLYRNSHDRLQQYTFVEMDAAQGGNHVVRNNIIYGRGGYDLVSFYQTTNMTVDNNCYFNGNLPAEDAGAVLRDPKFINGTTDPLTQNFHLSSTSPCMNAGSSTAAPTMDLDGVTRPKGTAVDIGAFEFDPANPNPSSLPLPVNTTPPPGNMPLTGLQMWLKFDETSGTVASDSSGNGINGTLTGGASWSSEGAYGGSAALNGSTGWVDIPDQSFAGDFTVGGWVYFTHQSSSLDGLAGQQGAGQDINFYDSRTRLYDPALGDVIVAQKPFGGYEWNHISLTRSGSTLKLYINGVLDQTSAWTGTFAPKAAGRGNAGFFQGSIDEFVLYNRALSDSEVWGLYSHGTGSSQSVNVAGEGTPIVSVTSPTGGGNHNLEVIRDGVKPAAGSADSSLQFDTVDGLGVAKDDYFGYTFASNKMFTSLVFQEGRHFTDGGWFKNGAVKVQVRIAGTWTDVAATVSPAYPNGNTPAVFGQGFETYTFTLNTPMTGDGIRIYGTAGGTNFFASAAELEAWAFSSTPAETNISGQAATIICSVTSPTGGGNKNIEVIRDGVKPAVGSTDSSLQYDTVDGLGVAKDDYFGYTFASNKTFTKLVFQEGRHFTDGGWFNNGAVKVQVRIGGTWTDVAATVAPAYPNGNAPAAFGQSFETYTFTLNTPATGDGIRIYGTAGGTNYFTSAGELEAWALSSPSQTAANMSGQAATIVCSVTSPTGGGNLNLEVIRDGVKPAAGSTDSSLQYDTVNGLGVAKDDYFGYTFSGSKTFTKLVFQEGRHFTDGGWFKNGAVKIQVRIGGTWTDVAATVTPAYPNGDTPAAFGQSFETYTFTLNTPTTGDGIRIYGTAGGMNYFTSAGELEAWGY